jgi:hypothetical protein
LFRSGNEKDIRTKVASLQTLVEEVT